MVSNRRCFECVCDDVLGKAQFQVHRVHQLKLLLPSIISSHSPYPCHPFSIRTIICVDPTVSQQQHHVASVPDDHVLCVLVHTTDRALSLVDVLTGDHV